MNFFLLLGSLLGLTGMILAAMVEHQLGIQVSKALTSIQTALRYQLLMAVLISALALFLATLPTSRKKAWIQLATAIFFIGTVCFCLSIYLKDIFGYPYFQKFIPWGGGLMIFAWLCLLISSFFTKNFFEE